MNWNSREKAQKAQKRLPALFSLFAFFAPFAAILFPFLLVLWILLNKKIDILGGTD